MRRALLPVAALAVLAWSFSAEAAKPKAGPPPGTRAATGSAPIEVTVTGLIIDAAGLGYEQRMSPKLYDEDNNNLLKGLAFDADQVATQGLASWMRTEPPETATRTGKRPLKVKALRVDGDRLILSNSDGKKVRDANATDKFLETLRITITY